MISGEEYVVNVIGIQLLGPVEVSQDGRRLHPVVSQSCLLAMLLLEPGRMVTSARLIDAVWGEKAPASARNTIQVYVHRLRRALTAFEGITLETAGEGYRLEVNAGRVDLHRFRRLVAEARNSGDDSLAGRLLRTALGLWQGPPLAGLPATVLWDGIRAGLIEERLNALEQRIGTDLRLGRHEELVDELAGILTEHPLRERFVGMLMVALHRSGKTAKALEVYEHTHRKMAAELGVGPGKELARLHRQVMAGDPDLDTLTTQRTFVRTVPRQLPGGVPGFTGRVTHLRELDGLQTQGSAVVITAIDGKAGVGKTALSVHFAHRVKDRFPDGQLYLGLRGFDPFHPPLDPEEALGRLLRGLGVEPENIPLELPEQVALYRGVVAGRRVLIVLDDAASADQVRPLLPGTPSCLVLVTSRTRLTGLGTADGARRLFLDVLAPAEATALLRGLLDPGLADAEPGAAEELARLCGYLPLALRIAAANTGMRPGTRLAEVVAELSEQNRLTALSVRDDDQTAVRATFDLSYRVLEPGPRKLFRRLGLVPAVDFGAVTASVLVDRSVEETTRLLDLLTAANLVERRDGDRYAMHDLLRLYAAEQAASDESERELGEARRRLFGWYLDTADDAGRLLYPESKHLPTPEVAASAFPGAAEALAWFEIERANLVAVARHAAEHGPREVAWRISDAVHGFFHRRRYPADWHVVAFAGLTAARAEGDERVQATMHHILAHALWSMARFREGIEHQEQALTLSRRVGWFEGEAKFLVFMGQLHKELGDVDTAIGNYERALAISRAHGLRHEEAQNLASIGTMCWHRGQLAQAVDHYSQALAIDREIGSANLENLHLIFLGATYRDLGELDRGIGFMERALAVTQAAGARDTESYLLDDLSIAALDAGRHQQAFDLASQALALAEEIHDAGAEADARNAIASADLCLGRIGTAVDNFRRALDICHETGYRHAEIQALTGLSSAYLRQQRLDEALLHANQAVSLGARTGYRLLESKALTQLAAVFLARKELVSALLCGNQALAAHRGSGHRLGEARTLSVLGGICEAMGETAQAIAHRRAAVAIFTAAGTPAPDETAAPGLGPDVRLA
jgi:DNA-binding SARP family transcriptional activator/tetratricopeptide (TPR) repeat protein